MIQDIEPYKYDNTFSKEPPKDEDYTLIFENFSIALKMGLEGKTIPRYSDVKESLDDSKEIRYLFSIDKNKFYLILNQEIPKQEGFCEGSIQIFRELSPQYLAFAGITAYQLYKWYSENIYCGKCGKLMKHRENARALTCEYCNTTKYPQISPAVIVGVIDKDKLLMSKYSRGNYKRYALLAGFTEIGETLEDTVRREVMEEVGIKVKNIRYYKNQPWSFSSSLLVGYFADLDGDNNITIDKEELSEALWVKREDIPKTDSNISLTSEMIEAFRNNESIVQNMNRL